MDLLKTPLHSWHLAAGARMAPFAGYEMPISYDQKSGGMLKEHLLVRNSLGMFDVCHMGEFWIRGPEASTFLDYATTRSVNALANNRAQYCLLLGADGGIIDDIIIYRIDAENFFMVVNASNMQKDFRHLLELTPKFKVSLTDVSKETGLIAIQGPKAPQIVEEFFPGALKTKYYGFFQPKPDWLVARTGYTGEDGFEIFLPVNEVVSFWKSLESKAVLPIGLGARDTLRLEVGFSLYGHELSESLRPAETFSAFAADLKQNFLGSEKAREEPRYYAVAIETLTPKPIRADDKLLYKGEAVGYITSGSVSPLKRKGMGLALLDRQKLKGLGIEVPSNSIIFMLESAGKQREAVLAETPFVATARVKQKAKT